MMFIERNVGLQRLGYPASETVPFVVRNKVNEKGHSFYVLLSDAHQTLV